MKKLSIYLATVLVITILLPTVIVKTLNFVPRETPSHGISLKEKNEKKKIEEKKGPLMKEPLKIDFDIENVKVYNPKKNTVETIPLDDYVKGVVAAEMPAEFHIEALKAQAVASRTYALYRMIKFKEGHPDHQSAPLCTEIHCQAYLSLSQLKELHGESWEENYWPKIEEAVESTKNLAIFYEGELIEPLYHSTSGGRTENVKDVFAIDVPYLKSVSSPYEEDSPRYKDTITMTVEDFIKKIKLKYPKANINKDNVHQKIKLIERTATGRVKRIAIDTYLVEGREFRDLFGLNSTNFTISLDKKLNIIEIETYGFGHGVGMSQWGANGMGKNGSSFEEIIKHYYTGVKILPIK